MKSHREPEETIAQQLADSGVSAPDTLLSEVLLGTGLADGYRSFDSPIGPVYVTYNPRGVSAVALSADSNDFEAHFVERFGRSTYATRGPSRVLDRQIRTALNTKTTSSLPVDLRGLSDFTVAVLRKVSQVPAGQVRPYAWIATEIGNPGAHREIGRAHV